MASTGGTGAGSGPMAHPRKGAQSVDLERFIDKRIRVKFAGGREMVGVLKGYDQLVNMVLDDTVEYLRDASDPTTTTEETRTLGLVVCRGPNVTVLSPEDGMVEIENPFLAAGEEGAADE